MPLDMKISGRLLAAAATRKSPDMRGVKVTFIVFYNHNPLP